MCSINVVNTWYNGQNLLFIVSPGKSQKTHQKPEIIMQMRSFWEENIVTILYEHFWYINIIQLQLTFFSLWQNVKNINLIPII